MCDHGFIIREILGENRFLCKECSVRFRDYPSRGTKLMHVGDSVWVEYEPTSLFNSWVETKITSIAGPTFILDDVNGLISLSQLRYNIGRWELPLQR